MTALSLVVDDDLLDRIAERAAVKLAAAHHPSEPEPWIDTEAAAAHLACSRQRIYDQVHMWELTGIPYRKDGARLLFRRSELDAWLEQRDALST